MEGGDRQMCGSPRGRGSSRAGSDQRLLALKAGVPTGRLNAEHPPGRRVARPRPQDRTDGRRPHPLRPRGVAVLFSGSLENHLCPELSGGVSDVTVVPLKIDFTILTFLTFNCHCSLVGFFP